jgi:hypothetical protein
MSNEPGGIEWDDAWLVTKGWGEDPVMLFPTKESAEAYKSMAAIPHGGVKKLSDYLKKKESTIKKRLIQKMDQGWTNVRNEATWED